MNWCTVYLIDFIGNIKMRLPCAKPLAFIVAGLSFLKPGLTNIQLDNMTLVATALVLGSGFNLSREKKGSEGVRSFNLTIYRFVPGFVEIVSSIYGWILVWFSDALGSG
jgi:hypothetical protein